MDETKNKSLFVGYLFAVGATALWSGNFIVARGLNESIPPISLAFYRWLVAIIFLFPFTIKDLIKEWQDLKSHMVYLCITSILGVTTFNTLIYYAGQTTTAMNLSLIAITFPFFIILFSRVLYKEYLTVKKGIGIGMVLIGVAVLITKGNLSTLLNISFTIGDLWMLLASIIFAIYSLFLKNKPEKISVKSLQISTFILGTLFLFPFFLWEQQGIVKPILTGTTIPAILYVGIFASLCAFILWNKSIIILGPSKAGMIYYSLPLFSGLLAFVFLNEYLTINHFFSMILILSGIIITNRN